MMTGSTQTLPITSPGPFKLPPGSLETVEELPGDSDLEDNQSDTGDSVSDFVLSNIEEDEEEEGGSLLERDPVFDQIKESLTRSQKRSESGLSQISSLSDESDGPQVQISEQYTSIPYGIQPRATYEHSAQQADIMGVAYNGRMRQFVILDPKGITTWKRDLVDPRVRRALQYPKYEYRLIVNIVYAPKYNCYFALGKDFSVKVLNRDFEETCSVNTDMRSVLYILFNPVRDELITGGVGGIKIWQFLQAAGKAFTELKPLANYELKLKESLPNVGGSWVKRVDLDHYLQHLYCCSDTDLHVYDLTGKLLFKFERAHTMSITGCCFSPSAKVLVTASVDSEVKVWSLTGGLVHTFRGHSRAVTGLLLHPDTSTILITSSLDGSIRMWSLDTMDLLYMIVVSADGVMWMGLTDDKMLYISTCRNITLWHLNKFYSFWGVARNSVTHLSLASAESKTTRVLAIGDDSSVRLFTRCNQKNITTVLPPPDISPLQKVLCVCYSREKNAAFLLITNKEIWVYTTRTDPSCRIAVWDVHDLQMPYISGDTSALPPGVTIQPPSQSMSTHRATENGHGNEIISNCCSLCILNSTAMMWTEEGLCCPIRHTYLLLGMEDGRVLFMDPVIKGQKYMEFKASKDAIQEMRHDVANTSLITLCRLKTLVIIQIWGLPQLDAMYEIYCGPDVTCFSRIGLTMMTGHTSGQINCHTLEPVEDLGMIKSKQEPAYETVVDEKRRPEHHAPLVAMDALISLRMFVTCSSDGGIKVWDENKVLVTEVMLETSLSAATFLNEMGDLIVGFKNHIFYIDHSKLFPSFKPDEVEMETSDQESDVYEDPRVLYEVIQQDEEPVTLENYLVPYDHLEFDKDFLEGKTKIEQPKGAPDLIEETETETESDISLAPSSIYLSPADSIESLSRIDLTLGADYSKYDLRKQMKSTLDVVFARGQKSRKRVTIETPGQSDMEEKEIEMELEKYNLPAFGESPGGSPSITPPSGQASPRDRGFHSEEEYSEEETVVKKSSGFVPIVPEKGTPASKLEKPAAEYEDVDETDQGRRKSKSVKVDVRGLMKKRRITSDRAPSLTRRASTDHSHDDHDHGHDDKRAIKKKQPMDDRKLPPRVDMSKLKDLPPNPPSMLSRKRSMSEQRKNLEINLLHHPEFPRRQDPALDTNLSHVKFDESDVEKLQEQAWAAEAGLHGKPLTLPPQRDKNQARMANRPSPGDTPSNRDRKFVFGNRESVEGQIPGVGSSPTAEMEEQDKLETSKDTSSSLGNKPAVTVNKTQGTSTDGKISRGTPDSGIIDDTMPPLGHQTPQITVSKVASSQVPGDGPEDLPTDTVLLTDEDRASAIRRPASSFTGLRRGQLEGERLRSERPHTAHVRFKAEDLQSAFEEALQRYQNLPGTPATVSAEKLYKNDGVTFEDNWQERAIERHTLLRMQKEIRAQSAAQRRQAMEMIQKDKMSSRHFPSRCDSAVGMSETAQGSLRATTSMSVPITMGYGLRNDSTPSREKQRPKTANPVLEKQQMAKSDLSNEKPFRYRLSKDAPSKSRPSSSRSISTVADFSPHWIDPRNPDAWRPKSSRSIPSKCNRYVLVNQPREKPSAPVPSPLEEQLLVERFPRMGSKLVQTIPESTPRIKKSYSLEYSPFVYQRFV